MLYLPYTNGPSPASNHCSRAGVADIAPAMGIQSGVYHSEARRQLDIMGRYTLMSGGVGVGGGAGAFVGSGLVGVGVGALLTVGGASVGDGAGVSVNGGVSVFVGSVLSGAAVGALSTTGVAGSVGEVTTKVVADGSTGNATFKSPELPLFNKPGTTSIAIKATARSSAADINTILVRSDSSLS